MLCKKKINEDRNEKIQTFENTINTDEKIMTSKLVCFIVVYLEMSGQARSCWQDL